MIIKPMAITRCPYCHAIIDEHDKYCNNCGTQLLFSEDDEIEEEIPGEKIVDAEVEEKDYTIEEPRDERRPAPGNELDGETDEDLTEGTKETSLAELVAEEPSEEDDRTEEVILVDEIEAGGKDAAGTPEPAPPADEAGAAEIDDGEEPEEDFDLMEDDGLPAEEERTDQSEEADERPRPEAGPLHKEETREYAAAGKRADAPPAAPEEPEVEYVTEPAAPDESATAGEAALRPPTFDTKELESLGRTVELSKDKVDEILEVMSEQQTPAPPPPPPPSEMSTPAMPTPEMPTPEGVGMTPTGSLPPWASTMKGAPVFNEETGPVETRKIRGAEPPAEETGDEVEIFPKRRAPDSTIGLPEKVSQSPLPFEEPAAGGDEKDEEDAEDGEGEGDEETEEEEIEETGDEEESEEGQARNPTPEHIVLPGGDARAMREPGPVAASGEEDEGAEGDEGPARWLPFGSPVFLKAKAFDVLFVGLFWLVALWLAARSMGMSLFAILGAMSGSMILLYVVFLVIYYFLFKFFLGETLGDRLFRPRE
jgi:hypothetical protein